MVMACSNSTAGSMIEMDCGGTVPHSRGSGLLGRSCIRHILFGRRHRLTSGWPVLGLNGLARRVGCNGFEIRTRSDYLISVGIYYMVPQLLSYNAIIADRNDIPVPRKVTQYSSN